MGPNSTISSSGPGESTDYSSKPKDSSFTESSHPQAEKRQDTLDEQEEVAEESSQQQPSFQIQHATEFEVEQDDFFQVQHEEQDNKVVTPSSSKTPPPSPAVEQES